MSWDAHLEIPCACGAHALCTAYETSFNYTHNTSDMIYRVLGGDPGPSDESWYERLNGRNGTDGAIFLSAILDGLRSDPDTFRAMNPTNGWGDYDSLVRKLTHMHEVSLAHPNGKWSAYG